MTTVVCLLTTMASCRNAPEAHDPSDDPVAIPLRDMGYATGLPTAPVTVVEFSDFGCPYCAQFSLNTYPTIHGEFVLSGQVFWVYIPFVLGAFPHSDVATIAAECAGTQNRFWQMHDLLYANQRLWRNETSPDETLLDLARRAGVEPGPFAACYGDNVPAERIRSHNQLATRLGVRATPTFFVNSRRIEGALPEEQFRAVLDATIANASATAN